MIPVHTSQQTKESAYGRVATMLSQRALVLPQHEALLRQMMGVAATPTPMGGLRIAAKVDSVHDDLPDALSLAVAGLPRQLADVPARPAPEGIGWRETPGGIKVPVPFSVLAPEASYLGLYGGVTRCGSCRLCYPAGKQACQWCGTANPRAPQRPAVTASKPKDAPPVAVANMWAADLMECQAGHKYLGAYSETCPQCSRGSGRSGGLSLGGLSLGGVPARLRALLRR